MLKADISVIIPLYNDEPYIKKTLDSVYKQLDGINAEIIVVDDCSQDKSFEIASNYKGATVYRNKKNSGPAKTRNFAISKSNADVLAFIDADVIAGERWLENIIQHIKKDNYKVIMGNVKIPESTYLGNCISALGFPGGGSIGFEKIWRVDIDGYTGHITSCNFAALKEIFEKYGYFDETFPYPGGEDPELSYRWTKKGIKIKYCSDVIAYHVPRNDMRSFFKWMYVRGKSNYYFKKKVGSVGSFIKLRIWSCMNIIKSCWKDSRIFLVVPLLFMSFLLQQYGYLYEAMKHKRLSKKK